MILLSPWVQLQYTGGLCLGLLGSEQAALARVVILQSCKGRSTYMISMKLLLLLESHLLDEVGNIWDVKVPVYLETYFLVPCYVCLWVVLLPGPFSSWPLPQPLWPWASGRARPRTVWQTFLCPCTCNGSVRSRGCCWRCRELKFYGFCWYFVGLPKATVLYSPLMKPFLKDICQNYKIKTYVI